MIEWLILKAYISEVCQTIRKWFRKDTKVKNIFAHSADGELCYHCKKPMYTKQGIISTVASGKIHQSCYSGFLEGYVDELITKRKEREKGMPIKMTGCSFENNGKNTVNMTLPAGSEIKCNSCGKITTVEKGGTVDAKCSECQSTNVTITTP